MNAELLLGEGRWATDTMLESQSLSAAQGHDHSQHGAAVEPSRGSGDLAILR